MIPGVAIALSFGAIAIESLVVIAAVFGPPWVRLLAAAAVIPMLTGFWLFQGVFWPSWWVLLLSFAPWHLIRRPTRDVRRTGFITDDGRPIPYVVPGFSPAKAGHYVGYETASSDYSPRSPSLRHVQTAFFIAAIGQQVAASVWRLELPPMVSAYDMYSKTYAGPDEYPDDGGSSHWLVAGMADGSERACRIDRDEARLIAALPPQQYTSAAAPMLASCFGENGSMRSVTVEERRPNIEWRQGRYIGTHRVRLSAVTLPEEYVK